MRGWFFDKDRERIEGMLQLMTLKLVYEKQNGDLPTDRASLVGRHVGGTA